MPQVLMVAYDFPPEGNAGAYRPLRFIRNLPSMGWQPTVVTVDTDCYERYDSVLSAQVPSEVNVLRVRNPDPWQALQARRSFRSRERLAHVGAETAMNVERAHQRTLRSRLRGWVRTAEAWCYHPDTNMGWIRPVTKAIVAAANEGKTNVLWATAGPLASFSAVHRASQQTGIPYVLDFRDAWTITFNDFEERQPHWAKRRAYRSMYRLLEDARAVVFRYATEAECFWHAYPRALDVVRVHIVPNGFDGEVEPYEAPAETGKCRILYTGTLGDYRYDTVLRALRILKVESPKLAECLQLHFVGEDNDKLGEMAESLDLGPMVTRRGSVGFAQVTQLSREAHALLVLGRYSTMRGYELFAPAKLFGYLKMARPIIGVLPEDEAKKTLRQVGVATIADVDSLAQIVGVLRRLLQCWEAGKLGSLVPSADRCRDFSGSHQTRLVATALAGKAAQHPFVPGVETIPPSLRAEIKRRRLEAERLGLRTFRQGLVTH